jgi:Tfp pilus assembly protein PilF
MKQTPKTAIIMLFALFSGINPLFAEDEAANSTIITEATNSTIISTEDLNYIRGNDYLKKGDYTNAEAEFKQSIEAHRDSVMGYLGLSALYLKTDQTDNAIAVLQEGAAVTRYNRELHLALASAYIKNANFDEAEIPFKVILTQDNEDKEALNTMRFVRGMKERSKESRGISEILKKHGLPTKR